VDRNRSCAVLAVAAGLAGALLTAIPGAAASCRPTVRALPGLGGTHADAKAMNGRGVVVGTAQDSRGDVKAVSWDRTRRIRVLETGSGLADSALGVNEVGAVVGIADDLRNGIPHAWYRSPRGNVTFLPVPPGTLASYAAKINNAGTVVGYVVSADERFSPALWTRPTAQPRVLPRRDGDLQGIGFGLNDRGTVVGGLAGADGDFVPARWRPRLAGLRVSVHTVPGMAHDVNARGQTAGVVTVPGQGGEQAVRWGRSGSARLLGRLPGGTWSIGYAVSSRGSVVGQADDATGTPKAFAWANPGPIRALPTLVAGGDSTANDVDDHGTSAGSSAGPDGTTRAVLWRCSVRR
jgi:probable HAF family extracellular repeat protein